MPATRLFESRGVDLTVFIFNCLKENTGSDGIKSHLQEEKLFESKNKRSLYQVPVLSNPPSALIEGRVLTKMCIRANILQGF